MQLEALIDIAKMVARAPYLYEFRVTLFLQSGVVSGVICSARTYEEGFRKSIHDKIENGELKQLWLGWTKPADADVPFHKVLEDDAAPEGAPITIYLKDARLEGAAGDDKPLGWWSGKLCAVIGFSVEVQPTKS